MGKRRFEKHARADSPPNLDNTIPANPQPTSDKIIGSTGNFFNKIGPHDISFCMFMDFVDHLRRAIGKIEFLDLDCPHKKNHKICPYLAGKLTPMRLKRLSVITDRVIAQAMGLKPRDFRYLKARIIKKLAAEYNSRVKILPPE